MVQICATSGELSAYAVEPIANRGADDFVFACSTCTEQMKDPDKVDANHWRCLNDSMWSEVSAVKVMAWRMLNRLKAEGWPQDLLDMIYLEEDEGQVLTQSPIPLLTATAVLTVNHKALTLTAVQE